MSPQEHFYPEKSYFAKNMILVLGWTAFHMKGRTLKNNERVMASFCQPVEVFE